MSLEKCTKCDCQKSGHSPDCPDHPLNEANGCSASTCSPSWTNDTPTETGWYWMRGGDSYGWHEACVEVDLQSNDHAEYYYDGEWVTEDKLPPNLEWSNKPISEPKENSQRCHGESR